MRHIINIVERLRWTITADTPARYPELVAEAADTIEKIQGALVTSLVAMTIASKLPGVSQEYDFEQAIAEVTAIITGSDTNHESIQEAINEERKRCAAIADRFLSTSDRDFSRGQHSAAFNIGLAIREPDQSKWAAMADETRRTVNS
jgi:hypothetical protein